MFSQNDYEEAMERAAFKAAIASLVVRMKPSRRYRVLPVMNYCESCTGYSPRPMNEYEKWQVCDSCLHLLQTAPDSELIVSRDTIKLLAERQTNCSCHHTDRQFYQDHGCCEYCFYVGKEA